MTYRIECCLVFIVAALISTPCFSAPVGGEVTSGNGAIQTLNDTTTVVTQESNSLSINWQSLNLSADELLRFEQPTSQSSALNTILDQQPTEIFGRIDANGRVFLMNPNGIIFGESARINVGAFAAGSFTIDENSFDGNGGFRFNTGTGLVENAGKISTNEDGGSIALIGQTVSNSGEINARLGKIHLLSADAATLSFDADGLIQFSVSKDTLENALGSDSAVNNNGDLRADGGYVVLEARAARNVYANVVNNDGLIQANSISNKGGVIRLEGIGGNIINTGDLSATGYDERQTGGEVSLMGDRVGVFGNATIDASGSNGGGKIFIGGHQKGVGDNVSEFTQVSADTTLRADAVTQGQGGEIVVWADDTTWATGTVSATGGTESGDGGFVEISGKQGLVLNADVDLTADNGSFGTLLLDPTDIVIHDQADGVQADDGLIPDLSDATQGAGSFDIGELALEGLAFNSNLILEATNDIIINDLADDNLDLIINSGGSIVMSADAGTADGLGSFTMDASDTITTQGSSITITGAGITLGSIDAGAGAVTLDSSTSIDMGAATSVSQAINVSVDSDNNGTETLTLRGALSGSSVNLQGGSNGGDTLIARDIANTWAITSLNAGTLNGDNFSSFTNLTGGSQNDTFNVTGIGNITGTFDGGGDTTGDTVDYSGRPGIISLTLNGNVQNVENVVGNGTDSSLAADDVANTWTITSVNDGTVSGVSFTDFSNLTGGTDTDDFTLNGGSVTGVLDGGAGTNSLTGNNAANSWNVLSANGGNIVGDVFSFLNISNLTGGSFVDTFVLNSGSISGTIDGGGGNDSLGADNVANSWTITANNAGTVTGVGGFQNIESLNGRNDTDDFSVVDGFGVSGTIDGGGGTDTIDLSTQSGAVVVDLSGTDYANIELYTGNASDSTIIGDNIANAWSINGVYDGLDDGTVGTVSFVNFNNITGGSDTDSFSLSTGTLSGALSGGGGTDTLVADAATNTWNIVSADAGTVTGVGSFSSIENLTGNIVADNFIFADGSNITGIVNGATGTDSVDYSAETGAVSVSLGSLGFLNIETFVGNNVDSTITGDDVINDWSITGANDGTLTYFTGSTSFIDFNNINGGSDVDTFTLASGSISGQIDGNAGDNTLIGDNAATTWSITGADSGTTTGVAGFNNINNLTGNLNNDDFVFSDPGLLSGVINGASGADSVSYAAKTGAVSVDLADTNFVSIETFIGNNTDSTLISQNVANSWSITGANDGTVGIIDFVNFNNLTGNADTDNFRFLTGGSLAGNIVGGLGTDSIQGDDTVNAWNITGANVGDLNGVTSFSGIELLIGGNAADDLTFSDGSTFAGAIDGGAGVDTVDMSAESGTININLSTPTYSNIENFIGNGSDSSLLGPDINTTWLVTGVDSGTVNAINFSGFNNITGNTQADDFQISSGSITGNLNGGLGLDTLTGDAVNNNWNIVTSDAGNVNNVANFSQIENIVGNNLADTFIFDNGADISGTVDGISGSDTVDYSAESGSLTIALGSGKYSNIDLFVGNNIDSALVAPVSSNNWTITGNNDGTIGAITFTNFNNLIGNVTTDYFQFMTGGSITGVVDGGSGLDAADFSLDNGTVSVALGATSYSRIETFIGNNTSSTLTGDSIANDWQITGVNDGMVGTTAFFDFNNLVGNVGFDDFTINAGSITGTVDGGNGIDSITGDTIANNWSIASADAGSVTGIASFSNIENLNGSSGSDTYTFADGSSISGVIDGAGGVDILDQSAQSGFVNLVLGGTGYLNIESFVGNGANSTLTGEDIVNTWTITGVDSGTVGPVSFTSISNLQGGSDDDSFTTNGGTITGSIDGGSGNDLILAENMINTWNITGANTGNITGINSFSDIETLQGNVNVDNYIFADGSSFVGVIDGAGGIDSVDYSSETGAVVTSLVANQFQNIESFTGNNINSTIIADNTSNSWSITGSNSGTLNSISFSGYNNLTGNSSADTFTLAGGNITGMLDGDSGNDSIQASNITNTWNVTSADAGDLTQVNAFQNIDNLLGGTAIDTFNIDANLSGFADGNTGDDIFNLGGLVTIGGGLIGGVGSDTLSGPSQNSNWIISAANSGFVNGTTFNGFETLNGGIGDDTFNFSNAPTAGISGGITGGSGNDDLLVDYIAASTRTINFDGGAGVDSISLTGTSPGLVNDYVFGPASDAVTITSDDGINNQIVAGAGIEIVTDTMTADSINLLGSTGNDVIQISPGVIAGAQPVSFQISGRPAVQFSNKTNLDIDAGAGTDSVTVNGVVTVAGDVTISSESVNQGSGGQLGADVLTFGQVNTIGSSSSAFATSVNTLVINGSTVDAYISEANGLAASVANLSGVLSISTSTGDITSAGQFNVSGTSSFNVGGGGSIILDNSTNVFSGTPSFTSSGVINDLVLVDNSAVDLPSLTLDGDLTIVSTGVVTQVGALSVQGNTSIDANNNSIILTDAANDFVGDLTLQNAGVSNTAITDINNLNLATSNVGSGTLTITAGAISQSGPLVQSNNAGTATFTATTGDIALTNGANEITGTLVINNTGPGDSALTDSSSLTLASSTTSGGDLTIIANDDIDLTGTTTSSGGDITITANLGDIQLGRLNSGSGRLTINAATGNVVGNTSPITDPNLSSQTLEIIGGTTIGTFNNPISVNVSSGGTSFFLSGDGVANIIGLTGTVLPGSSLVNNVTVSNIAIGQGQSVSFLESRLMPTAVYLSPLYDISDGGIQLYRFDSENEQDSKENNIRGVQPNK